MLFYILNVVFTIYTFLLIVRVFGSWFPKLQHQKWMHFVAFYTDPYLNLFRRIIPPLGMFDLSSLVAFFALQIARSVMFYLVGSF